MCANNLFFENAIQMLLLSPSHLMKHRHTKALTIAHAPHHLSDLSPTNQIARTQHPIISRHIWPNQNAPSPPSSCCLTFHPEGWLIPYKPRGHSIPPHSTPRASSSLTSPWTSYPQAKSNANCLRPAALLPWLFPWRLQAIVVEEGTWWQLKCLADVSGLCCG